MRAVKILIACFLLLTSLMSMKEVRTHLVIYRWPALQQFQLEYNYTQWAGRDYTYDVEDFWHYETMLNLYLSHEKEPSFLNAGAPENLFEFVAAEPTLTLWKQKHGCPTLTPQDSTNYTGGGKIELEHKIFTADRVKFLVSTSLDSLILRECVFIGSTERAVDMFGVDVFIVEDCYVELCGDGFKNSIGTGTHRVRGNWFKNITGPSGGSPIHGQSVQFITTPAPGMRINANYIWNGDEETADPQDNINLFGTCTGTLANPINIDSNFLWSKGIDAQSGSGINAADDGGKHTYARYNVLMYPGNVGIAVARGDSNRLDNNVLYQPQEVVSNVGLLIWNAYGSGTANCKFNRAYNNRVYWICGRATCGTPGNPTPYYLPDAGADGCSLTDTSGNIYTDLTVKAWERPSITSDIPLRFSIKK